MKLQILTEKEQQWLADCFCVKTLGDFKSDDFDWSCFKYRGVLDVYSYCLGEEEAETLLGTFEDHNLKYEPKFLDFFNLITNETMNEGNVYVNVQIHFENPLSSYDKETILFHKHGLDSYREKELYENLMEKLNYQGGYLKINSVELLNLLLKLSTRQFIFSDFYFVSEKTIIQGNWELSFPVLSHDKNAFLKYKETSEKVGLFIR